MDVLNDLQLQFSTFIMIRFYVEAIINLDLEI